MDPDKHDRLIQFLRLNTRWTQLYPGMMSQISRHEEIENQLGDMTRRGDFPDAALVIAAARRAQG